jgi:chromosome segregation ATPase
MENKTMNEPSLEDVIDSRDIETFIEECESEIEELEEALTEAQDELDDANSELGDAEEEASCSETIKEYLDIKIKCEGVLHTAAHELEAAKEDLEPWTELRSDCGSAWNDGMTLINEDYFEKYVTEMVTENFYIPRWVEVNWATTADNMKMDYTYVCIFDETLWTL